MLDSTRPGNIRHVNQTVDAVLNFDESAEISQVSYTTVNPSADLITLMQRLPGVLLYLLHSQADTTCLGIHAEYFHLNGVARVDDFAGMFDSLRPTHFRNVDE